VSGKRNSEDTKVGKSSDTGELLKHGEEKLGEGNSVVPENSYRNFEEKTLRSCPKNVRRLREGEPRE